jgi:sigma-B regulation protein RsbU (phosphoserine phosphatase)
LSIRTKIILGMLVVASLALGGFGAYSIQKFREDKMAYVVSSAADILNSKSLLIRKEIKINLGLIVSMYQVFANSGEFEKLDSALAKTPVKYVKYTVTSNTQVPFEHVYSGATVDAGKVKNIESSCESSMQSEQICFAVFDETLDLLFISQEVPATNGKVRFAAVMVAPETITALAKSQTGHWALVNKPNINAAAQTFGIQENAISAIFANSSPIGSTPTDKAGEPYILSFVNLQFGSYHLVALDSLNDALAVIGTMSRQYVIFLLGVFGVVLIISVLLTGRLTSGLQSVVDGTKKVASGDFSFSLPIKGNDEIGQLGKAFNIMTGEIQRLLNETAEKARMATELETAQRVQNTLFPPQKAFENGVEVIGQHRTASECGGDFWYYYKTQDELFVFIGDAVGHGVPAALMTSAARATVSLLQMTPPATTAEALTRFNKVIREASHGEMWMTFFVGRLNCNTGDFHYSSASHCPPVLIKASAGGEIKRSGLLTLGESAGPTLGAEVSPTYTENMIHLEKGDVILFYTDGFPEANNPEKEMWGAGFERSMAKSWNESKTLEGFIDGMVKRMDEFIKGEPLADDALIFGIRRT